MKSGLASFGASVKSNLDSNLGGASALSLFEFKGGLAVTELRTL
jgi:hypothetical protein